MMSRSSIATLRQKHLPGQARRRLHRPPHAVPPAAALPAPPPLPPSCHATLPAAHASAASCVVCGADWWYSTGTNSMAADSMNTACMYRSTFHLGTGEEGQRVARGMEGSSSSGDRARCTRSSTCLPPPALPPGSLVLVTHFPLLPSSLPAMAEPTMDETMKQEKIMPWGMCSSLGLRRNAGGGGRQGASVLWST